MKADRRKKNAVDRLTKRQVDAIRQAKAGNPLPLITCLLEVDKAIDKALSGIQLGYTQWGHGTIAHYQKIKDYLLSYLTTDSGKLLYKAAYDVREAG